MGFRILSATLFTFFLMQETPDLYGQKPSPTPLYFADSLFAQREWLAAKSIYQRQLGDTSTNSLEWNRLGYCCYRLNNPEGAIKYFQKSLETNPSGFLKGLIFSRLAVIYADENDTNEAMKKLDSAVLAGYSNVSEMDSLKDFNSLRSTLAFKELRRKVYTAAYPCMVDPHAREFDFWIGEWDVYVTGTKTFAGHSLIQMIAGGCALLENWDSPASTGKSINFIDPTTNKWKQSWAGSYAGGVQEFINGEYKDSAMRFEFETKDAAGLKVIGKFIFYNESPGQVRQVNATSVDDGRTWTTSYDFTYIRK
jgi:Tetratricopeptide repeat